MISELKMAPNLSVCFTIRNLFKFKVHYEQSFQPKLIRRSIKTSNFVKKGKKFRKTVLIIMERFPVGPFRARREKTNATDKI